jgi:hypothetical protein
MVKRKRRRASGIMEYSIDGVGDLAIDSGGKEG